MRPLSPPHHNCGAIMKPMPLAAGAMVALYAKPGDPRAAKVTEELSAWLRQRGYRPELDAPTDPPPALAVVLGGDGTMLHVAPRLAAAGTPVLAVHMGTLGFLVETAVAGLYPALEIVLAGGAAVELRALLRAELWRQGTVAATYDALNEVVVGKAQLARVVHIELAVNRELVGRYRADGVIVATPTGSTAYSLSAGGAVLHPGLAAMIVTPICPHALDQRPLVVPANAEVALTLTAAGDPTHLTVDGQQDFPLLPGDRIVCRRSPYNLKLLTAGPANFYQSLRAKLGWSANSAQK